VLFEEVGSLYRVEDDGAVPDVVLRVCGCLEHQFSVSVRAKPHHVGLALVLLVQLAVPAHQLDRSVPEVRGEALEAKLHDEVIEPRVRP